MVSLNLSLKEFDLIRCSLKSYLVFVKYQMDYYDSFLSSEDKEVNILRGYWHDEFNSVSKLIKQFSYEV